MVVKGQVIGQRSPSHQGEVGKVPVGRRTVARSNDSDVKDNAGRRRGNIVRRAEIRQCQRQKLQVAVLVNCALQNLSGGPDENARTCNPELKTQLRHLHQL